MPSLRPSSASTGRLRRMVTAPQRHPQLWLALICLIALAAYLVTSIVKFNRLRDGMDITIFDQAIRSFAQGHAGYTTLKAPGMPIFGDHFHPIILTMVPLYWLWDDPRMLLIAQGICIAWAGWLLGRLAIRRLGPGTGLLIAAGFLCGIGTQYAIIFDFHELVLATPLMAMALASFIEARWTACWVWSASLMVAKEDMCFLVGGIALAMLVRRHWVRGLSLGIFAVAWTAIAVFVVVPAFNPDHVYPYLHAVGAVAVAGVQTSAHGAWFGPLKTLGSAVILLSGTAFVALRSPLIWAFVAPFLTRAVSKNPQHWTTGFHYNLLPMLVACYAFVEAWPRLVDAAGRTLPGRRGTLRRWWRAVALPMVGIVALASIPLGPLWHEWTIGRCRDECRVFPAALAQLPAGSRVATDVYLTSHVAAHADVSQWRPPDYLDDRGQPVTPDWLLLDRETISYQNKDSHWVDQFLADPVVRGTRYEVVWQRDPMVILRPAHS
ncbi:MULTISPECIES: DUF2079 domain-containing protein [Propionibacterium]|uniref:DUF2079 domain-containing protein n=1 Tax=Propionibacterium TaxID=1743 RepID=UPI000543C567|nr:DUF2079 domain-containing protein [Propionibacterium freudenreichii]MDK9318674.1 DUF2079 domain-containing protein [Propionibacterium freudenreichii]MDK9644569.1 DUF2079 domain-containing protein [Propionibacterium freudenreichii]MDK9668313.1 DUF2079 domain-containing protein [Propionibacterium freudenreichii]CEG85551.1 Hypothetical membrane protein [Propionibacterium freudenreichii]CEI24369.1 Hypothetical membrane protein [Propionibacterium freudenreichii]